MPIAIGVLSRRSFIAASASFAALALAGCAPGSDAGSADADVEVVYNEELVALMGFGDPQDLIDASGDPQDSYEEAVANDDGSVTLKMSDEQLANYATATDNSLSALAEQFADENGGCSLSFTDDWQHVTCTLTSDAAASEDMSYVGYAQTAIVLLAQRQALSHPGDGSWAVDVTLTDAATGTEVGKVGSDGTYETYVDEWPGAE